MKLHENETLFRQAIQATAQRMAQEGKEIPEIFIEKDYWVTVALYHIFTSEAAEYAVFKGGTALSKCHRLIERFSEDVDMAVIREEGDTGNRLKEKLKVISKSIEHIMPEIDKDGVTNKKGMIRKTVHQYPKAGMGGSYGQVRDDITVESSWLSTSEPHELTSVSCYVTEMMEAVGQQDLISQYDMQPFKVRVLSKERTFCEKIMSLVRFSHTSTPYEDLSKKIRHVYDLNMMLKDDAIVSFFESEIFEQMLNVVGNDDVTGFKSNNQWLSNHPSQALIFKSPADTWSKIRSTYQTSFKDMLTGTLPAEEDLVDTLSRFFERLKVIKWEVSPGSK